MPGRKDEVEGKGVAAEGKNVRRYSASKSPGCGGGMGISKALSKSRTVVSRGLGREHRSDGISRTQTAFYTRRLANGSLKLDPARGRLFRAHSKFASAVVVAESDGQLGNASWFVIATAIRSGRKRNEDERKNSPSRSEGQGSRLACVSGNKS